MSFWHIFHRSAEATTKPLTGQDLLDYRHAKLTESEWQKGYDQGYVEGLARDSTDRAEANDTG